MLKKRVGSNPIRATARVNTFQRRRFASQMKPIQDCHPERSEGSLSSERSFAPLRMTKRDGLLCEIYWPLGRPGGGCNAARGKENRTSSIGDTDRKRYYADGT